MLYGHYRSPGLVDGLNILRDAVGKFFDAEFIRENERWLSEAAGPLCAEIPTETGVGGGDFRQDTVVMKELIGRTLG